MIGLKMLRGAVILAVLVTGAGGQWLEDTLELPDSLGYLSNPEVIVSNPVTGRVYVSSDPGVLVLDALTRVKSGFFRDCVSPCYCPGVEKLYLARDTVVVVDARADTAIGRLAFPGVPLGWAYSVTSRKLYAAIGGDVQALVVVNTATDSVVTILTGWGRLRGLAWDSVRNYIWVADIDAGSVTAVDCVADSVVGRVPVTTPPGAIALCPQMRKLYCTVTGGVDVVDTDSLHLRRSAYLGVTPDTLVYNPVTNRLYALFRNGVSIVDCVSDTVRATAPASNYAGLAFSSLTGRVYVVSEDIIGLLVVDTNDSVSRLIPLPGYENPVRRLAFSAAMNEVYCALESDSLLVVDAAAESLAGAIECTRFNIRTLVFNPAGNKLYALCPSQHAILVQGPGNTPGRRVNLGIDNYASAILTPAPNRLYVASRGWLWVIDCDSDQILDSLRAGSWSRAILVRHELLNRLYIFPKQGSAAVSVYDCALDTVVKAIPAGGEVPCVAYHPATDLIYFKTEGSSMIQALDPLHDTVIHRFPVATSASRAWMVSNPDRGLLYYFTDATTRLYAVDVLTDSFTTSDSVYTSVDTVYWNRHLDKLYLSNRADDGPTYVFDCRQNRVIDTLPFGPHAFGLMNDLTDKLYFPIHDTMWVIDCRSDLLAAVLPALGSTARAMAWNPGDNRVYAARYNMVAVYRDDVQGARESPLGVAPVGLSLAANPVRGRAQFRCQVPVGQTATLTLHDVLGRVVSRQFVGGGEKPVVLTWAGTDARGRSVPAGIYFARLEAAGQRATVKVVLE